MFNNVKGVSAFCNSDAIFSVSCCVKAICNVFDAAAALTALIYFLDSTCVFKSPLPLCAKEIYVPDLHTKYAASNLPAFSKT